MILLNPRDFKNDFDMKQMIRNQMSVGNSKCFFNLWFSQIPDGSLPLVSVSPSRACCLSLGIYSS